MDIKELVMAPGETNIPLPAPEQTSEPETQQAQMMPDAPALANFAPDMDTSLSALLPEPTPINANSVIVNASAQLQELENAENCANKPHAATTPCPPTLAALPNSWALPIPALHPA